jgi:hypothetical protein
VTRSIPWPHGCETCPPGRRQAFGCGCSSGTPWGPQAASDGFLGQATQRYQSGDAGGATDPPWDRTCPQWFYTSPFIQSVMDELEDYRGGRWGHVDDMPADLVGYLRIAHAELTAWENYQQGT